jgi:hypothetical protein
MKTKWTCIATLLAHLAVACGGGNEREETTEVGDTTGTSGDEGEGDRDDGVQIEGLMGTLSADEVNRGLEPRMDYFARCFADRYAQIEIVGGSIELAFRVGVDGRVKWVFPRASTVGDRETERCLLDVAMRARFHPPRGGEAEFSWPLAFDPPDDVRPPFNWETERVADTVEANGAEVVTRCGRGPFVVTVYVSPGGAVLSAGASTTEQPSAEALDCVAEAVRAWSLPDPGSYAAKVSFELR